MSEQSTHPECRKHSRKESTHHERETDEHEREPSRDDRRDSGNDGQPTETAEHAEETSDSKSIEHGRSCSADDLNALNRSGRG